MQGGMDFPDDITTNVFKIGDIKEVHWAFYTTRPKDDSILQDSPSSEGEEDLVQPLRLLEYKLREDGRHVINDRDKAGVWVFSMSETADEGIARTLGLDGLECIFVGSVRSGELVAGTSSNASTLPSIKTARFAQSTVKGVEELNAQAYGSNASSNTQRSISAPSHKTVKAWSTCQEYSVSEVYSKFITAISCSLSHSLGKRRGWTQVGSRACIDARTLGDDCFDNFELCSWIPTTTQLSFDVKWLSSGLMLISFFQVRLPRYSRVSKMLLRQGQSTGLAVGSPVLLSPAGIRCQYLGTEPLEKNGIQRKTAAKTKSAILSHLSLQGIRPTHKVTWIQVQGRRESNVSVDPPVALWPADLCLCEDLNAPVSGDDGGLSNRSIVDGSIDPLEVAESWFLGKSARIEASRARMREENNGTQAPNDVEDSDDEDPLSPFEISMDQGITPQDVSGIYPTPPDGQPPALLGSSNPHNLQSGDHEDEERMLQPGDEVHGDYDGQENDDLFGDMDIDMFASNGLTEADFSFFDEPGIIDEELRETGQVMALDDTNETTEHRMEHDGQELTATLHGRGISGSERSFAEDQRDEIRGQGSDHVFMTTDDSVPEKGYHEHVEPAVSVDDVDYGALEQLKLHRGSTSRDVDRGQRGSFEHVPFQRPLSDIDDKYNMQGRFAFDVDELPVTQRGDRLCRPDTHLSKITACPEDSSVGDSVEDEDTLASEDSDFHDGLELSLGSQAGSSRKRKREQLDEKDHFETSSPANPLPESSSGSPQNKLDEPLSDFPKPKALEQNKNIVDVEAQSHGRAQSTFTGRGQALVEVAQLIANQAVSGPFHFNAGFLSDKINLVGQSIPDLALQNMVAQLVSTLFPTSRRCSLKEYASLGEKNPASVSREQVVPNQRNPKPSHAAGGLTGTGQSIFKLDSPYTRVRRKGVSTELSASALSFWEELSLGPAHDPKDIDALCVCPKSKCVEEGAMVFLNMIKGAYQSCNLGSHDLGASLADYSERIVSVPINAREPDKFLQDIANTCEDLGTKLADLRLQSGTTVVYIINPFINQQYLPRFWDALLRLPKSYFAALEKRRPERPNHFAMQIIPLDLVWSPENIVVPSPAEYRRLAFEIYNQCDQSESGQPQESDFLKPPAVRLAKAVPKTIDFKLVSESSAPLMQADNCVHMSYAWDSTSPWLAATWTDNLGALSWRACYRLGKDMEKPWKPLYDVVKEILETSFEMLQPPNASWQLFVCKDSPMVKPENDVWLRALADSSRPSICCTILTVDANPRLTFTHSDLQTSSLEVAPGLLATPGATPQTNTPSPDISGLGSTPAGNAAPVGTPPPNAALGDHDSEARLVDITDETWGVVMDGTLDDLNTLRDNCTSVASGYLVKRAGPRDEDGLIPLGVNIVHGQKPYRAVLKEVLGMYRNLGTLARVRGVVDPVKSVLPLHVAAARKAWKAVSETMRYEHE